MVVSIDKATALRMHDKVRTHWNAERARVEGLTQDELTVFDLLTRPGPDLTTDERAEVKKVARQLLMRVRDALVLNWRQKQQARAQVKMMIEETLDEGLPRNYTPDLYKTKVLADLVNSSSVDLIGPRSRLTSGNFF
jgi:predicted nucleic acid-binding OB-fold protein